MKKLIILLLLTVILNPYSVFANEKWQEEYDYVTPSENKETYICETFQESGIPIELVADKNGNSIFGPLVGYIKFTPFTGIYKYEDENSKESLLDENGETIFGPLPGCINFTDSPDIYIYSENNNYSILDGKGNVITNLSEKYDNINFVDKISGYDAYRIGLTSFIHGIIDINGNIILPIEYDSINYEFVNGLMEVSPRHKDNEPYKYGFIDENFKIVIPPEYDEFLVCGDTTYACKKTDESFSYYKIENKTPVFYKTLTDYFAANLYENNENSDNYIELISIKPTYGKTFGRYGLADKDLNTLIEPKYDTPIQFYNNYAIIQYGSTEVKYGGKGYDDVYNGKYGVIDKKGNEVIKPVYDNIVYLENMADIKDGRFILSKDGKKEIVSLEEEINYPECSDWAKDNIVYGGWLNIIPDEINSDFSEKITRGEFCKLAVKTYLKCITHEKDENLEDLSIQTYCDKEKIDISSNPFKDTKDESIILANKLGIVSGKGDGLFCPDDTITRQEAAVMIINMADAIDYTVDADKSVQFSDKSYFASWAKESIYKVINFKGRADVPVMVGTEKNKFSPWYSYSREQAITTMTRFYDVYYWNF